MFERFTERAQRVVSLAREEARGMGHDHVGTEHLAIALVREEEGLAGHVLRDLGIEADRTRATVLRVVGRGEGAPRGGIPFTPRSKKVLQLALSEALALGHNYIGTEHLLLALVREREGVGTLVLADAGAAADTVRGRILTLLKGPVRMEPGPTPASSRRAGVDWPAALLAAAASFAEGRGRAPGVRVTLQDGERLDVESMRPGVPGELIGLIAYDEEGAGTHLVLVRTEAIVRADVIVDTRGDRGFLGLQRPAD